MEFQSTDQWDERLWSKAEKVYHEAFPEHGRKTRAIVRRMFDRGLCTLNTWSEDDEVVAMALTAFNARAGVLIIDYLAVRQAWRHKGIGRLCIENIRDRALAIMPDCRGIVIEVEAEETKENADRIRFWEKVGFVLTEYIHSYIWVPETYRAMYLSFNSDTVGVEDGKWLFKAITAYHEQAYRNKGRG
ncbi:GNAT family N-acetyltransferase [Cohnella cholangitidis]|uniref:GNAT family N-acetyltransferase n=1 Tax=Cohnella cholangitidis TaxID=2598458 RepID=A0A7G5BSD6_9BACL|nr:GNAT family N-acetyltransferase [Cohnella cholangitidis]QMV39870.1 GNAT family N-acetyltransferase [Cohnella cholangitidis]